jgi:hypothetical protein
MASDLEQLIEMGFDPERAQMAVSKTGGCTCWESFPLLLVFIHHKNPA